MPKSCGWDEAMLLRLEVSKTEAAREALDLSKDMYVGDAIAFVIKSFPAHKTQQLRRWNENWEGWCEWIDWIDDGWVVKHINPGLVSVVPPESWRPTEPNYKPSPSDDAVAAAVDAMSAKFLNVGHYSKRAPWVQFLYKIR